MRPAVVWAPLALVVTAAVEVLVFVLAVRGVGRLLDASTVVSVAFAALLALMVSLSGLWLLRREGVRAWRRFREALHAGRPPGPQVADGLVGLAGALLLAAPGFVTGLVGVLLLVPPGRPVARAAVRGIAERRMSSMLAGEVFGPRRVRVRRAGPPGAGPAPAAPGGDAASPGGPPGDADRTAPPPVIEGEVVEGEIVDPDPPK